MKIMTQIITLPKSRWQEYKQIRLNALRNNPDVFLTTYKEAREYPDEKWRERLNADDNMMLFAESEQKIVGMIIAFWSNNPNLSHVAEIAGLYVEPEFRQQGIGKQLLQAITGKVESDGRFIKAKIGVISNNQNAYQLYEKSGFTKVAQFQNDYQYQNNYYDIIWLEKLFR